MLKLRPQFKFGLGLLLTVFFIVLLTIPAGRVLAAEYWVNDPTLCPTSYVPEGVGCSGGDVICGIGGAHCIAPGLILKPTILGQSQTLYTGSYGAGFVINCFANRDTNGPPYCDNNLNYWCNASSTCYGTNSWRLTECATNKWAGDVGAAQCAATAPNSNTGCISGRYNCDGNANDCEVVNGSACDAGWGANTGHMSGCTCLPDIQTFQTGIQARFSTSSPLLWGTQLGTGELVRLTANTFSTSSFVVTNAGSVGIGFTSTTAPSASAALDVSSTNKGVLLPRLTTAQRDALTTASGLLIYNAEQGKFNYFDGSAWQVIGSSGTTSSSVYFTGDGLTSTPSASGTIFSIIFDSSLSTSSGRLGLNTSGFTSGTYGGTGIITSLSIDAYGRVTGIITSTLSSANLSDSSTLAYKNGDNIFTGLSTFNNTSTFNSTSVFQGPILVGTTTASGTMKIRVAGTVGANLYCDINGNNCFDPSVIGWNAPVSAITTTIVTSTGDFTTTTGAGIKYGYEAANYICNFYYPGYHFCFTGEVTQAIKNLGSSNFGNFGAYAWIAEGPPGYTANANDCDGYTTSSPTYLGAYWLYRNNGGGSGWLINCGESRPFSCCK